jgi:ribosomal protein L11 methyltransferase
VRWTEIKVTFSSSEDEDLASELISEIFQGLGTSGVVVDDPHLEPVEAWGGDAVPLPEEPAVTGYFPADERLEERCRQLERALAALAGRHSLTYSVRYQSIDEQDWAESWKAFFYPEAITPNLVVKPTWREFTPGPNQQVIEIDPGMAFGTGTHPTTALCVQLLEKFIKKGHAVLDVGTGSGILLIAAAKLGASRLTGVDLDPAAVAIARANLIHNRIAPTRFELTCGHLIGMLTGAYDLVIANILADVIIDLLDQVPGVLKPGGIFIGSGIIQAYRDKVACKMAARGLQLEEILERGEWVAMAGRLMP